MPRRIDPLNYVGIRPAPGAVIAVPQHPAADQPGLAPVANVDNGLQQQPVQLWPNANAAANYHVYNVPAPQPLDPNYYVGGQVGADVVAQPPNYAPPQPPQAVAQALQDVAQALHWNPGPGARVRPENRDFDPKVWDEIHNLTKEVMELKKTVSLLLKNAVSLKQFTNKEI